jgi:flavin-dependent dehydrogenase
MLYDFSPMTDGLRGYLWVFPVAGDWINVGLMHDPGDRGRNRAQRGAEEVSSRGETAPLSGGDLEALLRRHLDRLGITLPRAARGWPAFGYHPSAPIGGPHLLTVGDAAGIDALTGEGIAVGMEQALVAADAIVHAFDSGDFEFRGYARAVRKATVGRELAIDRWLARLLYRGNWKRWLSLVLLDERMLELYAARVSGTLVLADHKRELVWALLRHLGSPGRTARLTRASASAS